MVSCRSWRSALVNRFKPS